MLDASLHNNTHLPLESDVSFRFPEREIVN